MSNKKDFINYNELRKMSRTEKIETLQTLTKRANTRLATLEKKAKENNGENIRFINDKWAYGKVKKYTGTNKKGQVRFYRGKKYDSLQDINRALQEVTNFLNSKSSTIKGIKDAEKKRFDTFVANHKEIVESFAEQTGIEKYSNSYTKLMQQHADDFYKFMSDFGRSELFKLVDSNQVMDDFALALAQGQTIDEIEEEYQEFMTTEITFEQVAERHKRAKWQLSQNGGKLFT